MFDLSMHARTHACMHTRTHMETEVVDALCKDVLPAVYLDHLDSLDDLAAAVAWGWEDESWVAEGLRGLTGTKTWMRAVAFGVQRPRG